MNVEYNFNSKQLNKFSSQVFSAIVAVFKEYFDEESYTYIAKVIDKNINGILKLQKRLCIEENFKKDFLNIKDDSAGYILKEGMTHEERVDAVSEIINMTIYQYRLYVFETFINYILDKFDNEDYKEAVKNNLPNIRNRFDVEADLIIE